MPWLFFSLKVSRLWSPSCLFASSEQTSKLEDKTPSAAIRFMTLNYLCSDNNKSHESVMLWRVRNSVLSALCRINNVIPLVLPIFLFRLYFYYYSDPCVTAIGRNRIIYTTLIVFPLQKKKMILLFTGNPTGLHKPQFWARLPTSHPLTALPSHKGALLANEIFSK